MENNISFLKRIFDTMQNPDVNNSYMSDKQAIVKLFNNTKERTIDDIRLRLTVIDSMYSTQIMHLMSWPKNYLLLVKMILLVLLHKGLSKIVLKDCGANDME